MPYTPEQLDRLAISLAAWALRETPAQVVATRLQHPEHAEPMPLPAQALANLEADMKTSQERAVKEERR
jgi:hypothetical protein